MIPCIIPPSATRLPCFVLHTSSHCPRYTWPHFIAIMRSDLMIPTRFLPHIVPKGKKSAPIYLFLQFGPVALHFICSALSYLSCSWTTSFFLFFSPLYVRFIIGEQKPNEFWFLFRVDFLFFFGHCVLSHMSGNRVGSLFFCIAFSFLHTSASQAMGCRDTELYSFLSLRAQSCILLS